MIISGGGKATSREIKQTQSSTWVLVRLKDVLL